MREGLPAARASARPPVCAPARAAAARRRRRRCGGSRGQPSSSDAARCSPPRCSSSSRRCSTTRTASSRGSPAGRARSAATSTRRSTCSSTRRSSPHLPGRRAARRSPSPASSRSRASSASTSTSNGCRGPAVAEPEAEAEGGATAILRRLYALRLRAAGPARGGARRAASGSHEPAWRVAARQPRHVDAARRVWSPDGPRTPQRLRLARSLAEVLLIALVLVPRRAPRRQEEIA